MIRWMTVADIEHIQQIAKETYRVTYENRIPLDVQQSYLNLSYSNMMLHKRMEKTMMLIAECHGTPVGFINFTQVDEDGDAEITELCVLPSFQQSRYGQKLFQAALSKLSAAKQLFVYVDSQNAGGHIFCEKQGFELIGTFSESFFGHPVETAEYVYKLRVPVASL